MAAANKSKQAKAVRLIYANQMQELKELAERARDDSTVHAQFKMLYGHHDSIYKDFKTQHIELIKNLALQEEDMEAEEAVRKAFEFNYATVYAIHTALFPDIPEDSESKLSQDLKNNARSHSSKHNIKLPKIEIRKFDGDLKQFKPFIDIFDNIIHNNSELSKVEKFNYLIASLSGTPLKLVQCTPVAEDNYQIAYEAIVKRYDNTFLISMAHLKAIDSAPKVTNYNDASTLRSVYDIFTENIAALKNMGYPVDEWDLILFYLFSKHIDADTMSRYQREEVSDSTGISSFQSLKSFVVRMCNALDSLVFSQDSFYRRGTKSNKDSYTHNYHDKNKAKHTSSLFTSNKLNCYLCKLEHLIYKCPVFVKQNSHERFQFIKQSGSCMNCLSNLHKTNKCNSQSNCRKCQMRHHTLLHFDKPLEKNASQVPQSFDESQMLNAKTKVASSSQNLCSVGHSFTNVLLSTAIAEIKDSFGNYHRVRLVLDTGSQSSYISKKLFQRLGLSRSSCNVSIQGLGTMRDTTFGAVRCVLRPLDAINSDIKFTALILPKLCADMPTHAIDASNWSHITNLKLADPSFYEPSAIDVLLGADIFPYILQPGTLKGEAYSQPVALNTIFGWVIMGNANKTETPHNQLTSLFASSKRSDNLLILNDLLKRFWEIEEISLPRRLNPDDERAENIFRTSHFRMNSGRYVVELPFKIAKPNFDFAETRSLALRRFYSLEKRLRSQPLIYEQYTSIFQEYLNAGVLEKVSNHSHCQGEENSYYIPYHNVIKDNKIRIVYDASAKCSSGTSLKDELLTGPKLQKDIFSILLQFRTHRIVFTADIKGMFTQIAVAEKHQNYQRILWRFSEENNVQDYRFKTVIFGLSSSPFLANRVIIQLVEDEGDKFPAAKQILKRDIYVDDIATGADSLEQAKLCRDSLIELLKLGCFELRKLSSNCEELLDIFPDPHKQSNNLELDLDSKATYKILGLQWQSLLDVFSYKIDSIGRTVTKRNVLSDIARIYDILGFLTPVVFFAKSFMQQLWQLGLEWDETPNPSICNTWIRFKDELSLLEKLSIPRKLFSNRTQECQLHGFCDASLKGYAAVVYFRVKEGNTYFTVLIAAKSKLAPIKTISIPRLELCAALLLSKLMKQVIDILKNHINLVKLWAWSDSKVCLTWIKSASYKYKTFVNNRISQIQDKLSPEVWRYVPSADNPADGASRGQMPSEFLNNSLWWAGPEWLRSPETFWPSITLDSNLSHQTEEEERKLNLAFLTSETDDRIAQLLEQHSSLAKIVRIIAYIKRFIARVRKTENSFSGHLVLHELEEALFVLVKFTQHTIFAEDVDNLKRNKATSKPLRKLNAFLDETQVIRVGGRLIKAEMSYAQMHPAIVPRTSRLTDLLISHYHAIYLHPGLQTLQYLLLQKFWILSPKRAIHKVISSCRNCWKLRPTTLQPPMGNLPKLRISQAKPFACVGIYYAGPFLTKLNKSRGSKTQKSYICIFVCFATRAIHIELASDLTTEVFLAAFRRFIARRGRCSMIYSDCGTNFVGAQKEIALLMKSAAEIETIDWHFNPPHAPHFSGLAEAGVKSVKTHLHRVIGEQILTYEELYTLLTQIESLLNSRPLSPISSDPNDISALTPGHFLTLEPLTALPDPDLSHLRMNQLDRWQLLQRLQQHFWSRWHKEYLHTLQQRAKWLTDSNPPKVGTLVLIKDDRLSPFKWLLGRITRLYSGNDGVARVADILSKSGTFKRPLVKLEPLPLPEN